MAYLDSDGLTYVLQKISNGSLAMNGTLTWKSALSSSTPAINTNNHNITVGSGYLDFSSDKRLKQNINACPSVLDKVLKTEIKTFEFKTKPNEQQIGVIAQDVQNNFKENNLNKILVHTQDDGFLSVNETKFVYVLWKAFTEYVEKTDKEINDLKSEIELLKNKKE